MNVSGALFVSPGTRSGVCVMKPMYRWSLLVHDWPRRVPPAVGGHQDDFGGRRFRAHQFRRMHDADARGHHRRMQGAEQRCAMNGECTPARAQCVVAHVEHPAIRRRHTTQDAIDGRAERAERFEGTMLGEMGRRCCKACVPPDGLQPGDTRSPCYVTAALRAGVAPCQGDKARIRLRTKLMPRIAKSTPLNWV
jgi:hypothetical protein